MTNTSLFVAIVAIIIIGGGILVYQNQNLDRDNETNENSIENRVTENNNTENERENTNDTVLDLSGDNLTETPAYVFSRTSLEELNLSGNKLEGSLEAEIRNLQNLRILDLSDNQFTGVPAEIGQLSKLEMLDLSNNNLTGLPQELGNLSNLRTLDLRGNNYSEGDLATIKAKLSSTTVVVVD